MVDHRLPYLRQFREASHPLEALQQHGHRQQMRIGIRALLRPHRLIRRRHVEHVQLPGRHQPRELRIRRPFDRCHRSRPLTVACKSRGRTCNGTVSYVKAGSGRSAGPAGGGVGEDLVAPEGGQVFDLAAVVLAAGGHPRVPDLRDHAAPARRAGGAYGRPGRGCPHRPRQAIGGWVPVRGLEGGATWGNSPMRAIRASAKQALTAASAARSPRPAPRRPATPAPGPFRPAAAILVTA